jgi:nicotinamide-nucleotide amidase
VQAVILSIGSELVTGLRVDTHGAEIARALAESGIDVIRHEALDDDTAAIAEAFRRASAEAGLVVATGGLGPTPDDLTREALAEAMDASLEEDVAARKMLDDWAASRGRTLSESNLRQARLPVGGRAVANPVGSAPGVHARLGRAEVFCLPGVPHEMRTMLAEQVLPCVAAAGGEAVAGRVSLLRTVRTLGSPESEIGERLSDLMLPARRVRVATAAHAGIIDVHLHATGPREEVVALLDAEAVEVRRRLGRVVFAEGRETLAEAVAGLLATVDKTLALAESCTGGMVASELVAVPGISEHFLEGVVCYSDASKTRLLGVPGDLIESRGAVSEPVARAMAEGARDRAGADLALSLTGIAGPTGGRPPQKPVGTVWFALAGGGGTDAVHHVFPGDREHVRSRATNVALNLLRLHLRSKV